MKFTGITLITQDVLRLTAFYADLLGVEYEGDNIHMALKTQGAELTIISIQGMENLAPDSMAGAGYGSTTLSFEAADVDGAYEKLRAMNVEFVKLPKTHPWGTRSFWFRDPDGNIVNFFSQVSG